MRKVCWKFRRGNSVLAIGDGEGQENEANFEINFSGRKLFI